uniref:Uncharacterized protein n=1 Tax=viral metagenome TaxID=1070528 RepID=A0A6M3J923_9ZZZZ
MDTRLSTSNPVDRYLGFGGQPPESGNPVDKYFEGVGPIEEKPKKGLGYYAGIPAAPFETAATLGTGMLFGLPASGLAQTIALLSGGTTEEATGFGEEFAQQFTYEPKTQAGMELTEFVGGWLEKPAQLVRSLGNKMYDIKIAEDQFKDSPDLVAAAVTGITTPLEFIAYALLFKGAKGAFGKGSKAMKSAAAKLSPKDTEALKALGEAKPEFKYDVEELLKWKDEQAPELGPTPKTARTTGEIQQWTKDIEAAKGQPPEDPYSFPSTTPTPKIPGPAGPLLGEKAPIGRMPQDIGREVAAKSGSETLGEAVQSALEFTAEAKTSEASTAEQQLLTAIRRARRDGSYRELSEPLRKVTALRKSEPVLGEKAPLPTMGRPRTRPVVEEPIVEEPSSVQILNIEPLKPEPKLETKLGKEVPSAEPPTEAPVSEWTTPQKVDGRKYQFMTDSEGNVFVRHPEGREFGSKSAAKAAAKTLSKEGVGEFEVVDGPEGKSLLRQVKETTTEVSVESTIKTTGKTPIKTKGFLISDHPEGKFILPEAYDIPRGNLEGAPIDTNELYKLPYFALAKEVSPGRYEIVEVNVSKELRRKSIASKMYKALAGEIEKEGGSLYIESTGEGRTKLGTNLVEGLRKKGIVDESGRVITERLEESVPPNPRFKGWQETAEGPPIALYDIDQKMPDGSIKPNTQSAEGLRKLGIEIPETPPAPTPTAAAEPSTYSATLYHASKTGELSKTGRHTDEGVGVFLTPDEGFAKDFGEVVKKYDVKLDKVLDLSDIPADKEMSASELVKLLNEKGLKVGIEDLKLSKGAETAVRPIDEWAPEMERASGRMKEQDFDGYRRNVLDYDEKPVEEVVVLDESKVTPVAEKPAKPITKRRKGGAATPEGVAKKYNLEYKGSEEVSVDETGKPVTEYTFYDPQTGREFVAESLRTVGEELEYLRKIREEPTLEAEPTKAPISNVADTETRLKEIAGMDDYDTALVEVGKTIEQIEKGKFDTAADKSDAIDMAEDFQSYIRRAKEKAAEKTSGRVEYEHKPLEPGEKVAAVKSMLDFEMEESGSVGEAVKSVTKKLRESKTDIEDDGYRSVGDTARDLVTLFSEGDETGAIGMWDRTRPKGMTGAQKEALSGILGDAKRIGKDVEKMLKDLGFNTGQIREVKNMVKEVEGEAKSKALDPENLPKVIKHKTRVKKGVTIERPPVTEGMFRVLESAAELTKKKFGGWFENPMRFFEEADWGERDGHLKNMLYRMMTKKENLISRELEQFNSRLKDIKSGTTWRSRERVSNYGIGKQKGGPEILKEMGVERVESLTGPEEIAYNKLRTEYDTLGKRVNDIRVKVGREPFKWVEDYFTFFRDLSMLEKMGVKIDPTFDISSRIQQQRASIGTTPFRFAKARIGSRIPVELDPFYVMEAYGASAVRHIHMSPVTALIRELRNPIKHPDTGKMWQLKYHKPRLDEALRQWGNFLSGQDPMRLPGPVDRSIRMLNRNLTYSILSANLRSALIQPSALKNTVVEIGAKYTFEGIKGLLDPAIRAEVLAKSKVIHQRVYTEALTDAFRMIKGKRLGEAREWLGKKGLAPLQLLDMETAKATWRGAYLKAKEGLKYSEEKAINYADDVVTRSQASSMAGDLSPVQRTALGKALTMFQTYTISELNFLLKDVLGMRRGSRTLTPETLGRIAGYIVATTAFNILYENILGIQSPFPTPIKSFAEAIDNDESVGYAALMAAKEFIEPLPILGGGVRYSTSPLGAPAELLTETFKKFGSDPMQKSWLEIGGKWLGVPGAAQIAKSIKASKRGESGYDIIMGNYTKEGKKRDTRLTFGRKDRKRLGF